MMRQYSNKWDPRT